MDIIQFYINNVFFVTYILFLLLVVLVLWNWRRILIPFAGLRTRTLTLLLLIFLAASALRIFVFPPHHLLYIDEPWFMETAKGMLASGKPLLNEYVDFGVQSQIVYPKSIGWPFLIAIAFRIIGISNLVAIDLSGVLGSLSVILVFALAYLLFSRADAALWSALVAALLPLHIVWSATAETTVPSIFFALLTLVLFMLCFKTQEFRMLFPAMAALAFALQMRIEYALLLVLVFAMFILFDPRPKNKLALRFLAPFLLLLIASSVTIPQLVLQRGLQEDIYHKSYFGLGLFSRNLGFGTGIVTSNFSLMFIGVTALGLFMCLRQKRKALSFLAFWFALFFFFYLSFIKLQDRMLVLPLVSLTTLTGFGLSSLGKLGKGTGAMYLRIMIAGLFIGSLLFQIGQEYHKSRFERAPYVLETRMPEIAQRIIPGNCYVVTEWPTILSSTTDLKVVSTRNIVAYPEIVANLLDRTGCVFYFQEGYCLKEPIAEPLGSQERCALVHQNYKLDLYVEYKEKDVAYDFYRLALK
jgi:hypothetical protein